MNDKHRFLTYLHQASQQRPLVAVAAHWSIYREVAEIVAEYGTDPDTKIVTPKPYHFLRVDVVADPGTGLVREGSVLCFQELVAWRIYLAFANYVLQHPPTLTPTHDNNKGPHASHERPRPMDGGDLPPSTPLSPR